MPSPNKTGGPLVKTGPTAGQVRATRKSGSVPGHPNLQPWYAKRNDAGKSRK